MSQSLSNLLGPQLSVNFSADFQNHQIMGVSADSRDIKPGFIFFAIPGVHVDGHDYIPAVIRAGALAIVYENPLNADVLQLAIARSVTLIKVEHSRTILSQVAARWQGNPAEKMTCVGITGTDGKSTTTYFIHQLLEFAGRTSGFFSTVAMQTDDRVLANGLRQSTPEALELHAVLAEMVVNRKEFAIIESTSHGLSHRTARLRDVSFHGAVFTNLSHEHLEFHGSYEQYRNDKGNLFREIRGTVEKPGFGIINASDPEGAFFAGLSAAPVYAYAIDNGLEAVRLWESGHFHLFADQIEGFSDHCSCRLRYNPQAKTLGTRKIARVLPGHATERHLEIPLPGTFNIENVMAALLTAACLLDCSPIDFLPSLQNLRGIKGRMVPVNQGQPFSVIVDYAHTPGAYSKVLPMFRASTKGRLIVVFGSAGERDKEKRPMQGALAARWADVLVLTNEDPRLEDELVIIEQIKAGALTENNNAEIHCIPDRRMAIAQAMDLAKSGDLIVLLGKGHEQSIIYPDGKHSWDEETVAREILSGMGWGSPENQGGIT